MSIHGSIAGWASLGLTHLRQFAQNPRNVIHAAALIGTIRLGFCFAPSASEIRNYFSPEPICTQDTFLGFPYGDPACTTPEITFQRHIEQIKDIDSSFLVAGLAAIAIPSAIAFIRNQYLKNQTPPAKAPPVRAPLPKNRANEGVAFDVGKLGNLSLTLQGPNSKSPLLFIENGNTVTRFELSQMSPAVLSENLRKLLGEETCYREFGGIIQNNLSNKGNSVSLVRNIPFSLIVQLPSIRERLLLSAPGDQGQIH